MIITSKANSKIKRLRSLYKDKKMRQNDGIFVCEGHNLIKDIPDNIKVIELFIRESEYNKLYYLEQNMNIEALILPDNMFDSVADTVTPSGVIALVEKPESKDISGEIVILLCGISDMGNLGTIIRTAAACGIDDIVCVDCADCFSPKTVRSSMGGIFYENIIECNLTKAFEILHDYDIISLDMKGISIHSYKKKGKIAVAVGSEAHGIPEEIKKKSKETICLPMREGRVESLNAAVSAGIAMYLLNKTEV